MKNIITQSLAYLIIYASVLGVGYSIIDIIGWYFMYSFVAGFLIYTITTSRFSWIVTILQFLIVGFLSFLLIGYLYNKIYEPYIEQNYYQNENTINATIGLIELFIIKLISDFALVKIGLEKKESIIDKLLPPTKAK